MTWLAQHRGTLAEPVWRMVFEDQDGDPRFWDQEPEQAVLSLLWMAPERVAEVAEGLHASHFQHATLGALYGALHGVWRAGRPPTHAAWLARLSPPLRSLWAGLVVGPWSADELVPCALRVAEDAADREVAALLRRALSDEPGDRRAVLLRLGAAVDAGLVTSYGEGIDVPEVA